MSVSPDATGILKVTGRGGFAVFLLFAGVHTCLTVFSVGGYRSTPLAFVALALIVSAGFLASIDDSARLPARLTIAVVALSTAVSLSVWNLPPQGWPGWASWVWGAVTFVAFLLTLRRRTGAAWIAFGLMTTITIVWCLLVGRGALAGFSFVIRSAALLFVATLFGVLLERTRRTIVRVQESTLQRAVAQAAATASLDEQKLRLAQLRAQATPALHRILSDEDLSADDRRYFGLVEGALRDQLRASALVRPAVVDAARRARSRGVDVSMMSDRDDGTLRDDEWDRVEEAVVDQLDAATSGQVTVRLLPSGRATLATIVSDDEGDTVRRVISSSAE